jgi:hypothetical protein
VALGGHRDYLATLMSNAIEPDYLRRARFRRHAKLVLALLFAGGVLVRIAMALLS